MIGYQCSETNKSCREPLKKTSFWDSTCRLHVTVGSPPLEDWISFLPPKSARRTDLQSFLNSDHATWPDLILMDIYPLVN